MHGSMGRVFKSSADECHRAMEPITGIGKRLDGTKCQDSLGTAHDRVQAAEPPASEKYGLELAPASQVFTSQARKFLEQEPGLLPSAIIHSHRKKKKKKSLPANIQTRGALGCPDPQREFCVCVCASSGYIAVRCRVCA